MNVLLVIIFIVIICFLFKRYVLEKICITNFQSRHVFITGCDSGFGHLLALKLVEKGIPTFAGCLTEEGKIDLEKKSKWMPGKMWMVSVDVTSDKSVVKALEFVKSELKDKGLWGLVCNAGVANAGGPDDWLNIDDYKKVMEVNAYGVIRTCHAFKPLIKKTKGRIVVMTSMLGRISIPHIGPYCVSKFAAEAYADILRMEGRDFGYTVHILEPGFFPTNINEAYMQKVFDYSWNRLDEDTKREYGEEYYLETKKLIKQNLDMIFTRDNNPNDVVDAYYNALVSRFPRLRYHIGRDARLIYIPLASWYPTPVQDFFHHIIQLVRGYAVPAVCKK